MTIPNSEPRFDGYSLPQDGGTFPWDFADRINRLKEASGLTWSGMARALGVDRKQLRRWCKQGVEPSGGAMLSPGPLRPPVPRRPGHPHRRGRADRLPRGLRGGGRRGRGGIDPSSNAAGARPDRTRRRPNQTARGRRHHEGRRNREI